MKPVPSPLARLGRALATAALAFAASGAPALEVTGSFTGWWGQPDQENHGVIVSVSRRFDGSLQGVLYWAVYDDQGNPSWFLAQGPINGDTINAELFAFEGPTFMQPDDPDNSPGEQIGTMQVQFNDCANGNVDFESTRVIVGTGGFRIRRLTNQPGTNCSGGTSDNTPPTAPPEEFRVFLAPTGAAPGASGKADFEQRPGRTEFSVEVEDLEIGSYTLRVGGEDRGSIDVVTTPGGNEGEIEFRSPPEPGKVLLTFDPRGQIIEVLQGGTVVLETISPDSGQIPGSDEGNPPPFGNLEIDADLMNAGVFPAGSGDAELELRSNRVDFDVEIEDVPVGPYTLRVDGVDRGTIDVVDTLSGPEGELEFSFPTEPGKLPLDFDPRGLAVEVLDGNTLVFSLNFPTTGTGGDDDDDDDGGGDDGGGDDGDDGDTGETRVIIGLDNAGVFPAASGDAEYEVDADRTDFKVEIEDVPDGSYDLRVGGTVRGQISVSAGEGELEFRDPVEPGKLPLDFDPRGELIEVLDGATVILSATFP